MKKLLAQSSVALLMISLLSLSNTTFAAQDPAKSSNVRSTLIGNCKETINKAGKLNASEADKFCACQIDSEGRMTKAQEWQIISTINQKKNPATLPFVQQQQRDLQACIGTALSKKLQSMAQQSKR
ncbi:MULTISPECIES: hypothetical protein [unclassified Acinetobacter]|uniref:hypothetical protein n=1 Tax=unclassified Acinetobacter TaxID=196816 RepID=UPI0035BA191F